MKTKLLTLMTLTVLSLVMLMSFAVATTSTVIDVTDITAPSSVDEDAGSFTFTFNLTYTGASTSADISFADSSSSIGTISIPTATGMDGPSGESRIITGTISNFANQGGNTMNGVINATFSGSTDDENTFSVIINDVTSTEEPEEIIECELTGNPGDDLRIKSIDFNNEGMNGVTRVEFGDDDEWFPLDDIEVEIEVENNGDDDIDDIELEWGLWDIRANEWAIDPDEEKDFNLNDDDEETVTFTFNLEDKLDIDLEDLNDGNNYRFYVFGNGEVDDGDDTPTCASDFETIGLVIEDDFVVLSDFQFSEVISCDSTFQVLADIWNIGDGDQEDVFVRVSSSELGISEIVEIGDVDAFDKEDFSVSVEIPGDIDEKFYSLRFEIFDEDNDLFETDFDDDEAVFDLVFQVSGGCNGESEALVSASLESGGRAGEALVVRATIINTGSESANYNLNAQGFGAWANSANVEPSIVLLSGGESRDALITFDVSEDAAGENSFNIEVVSDNQLVLSQPVSVSIEEAGGFGFTGGALGSNAYLWGIGLLNIILVIIIIIVAIRVARK